MKQLLLSISLLFVGVFSTNAQHDFEYKVVLNPVTVNNMPGLHSYAFAQHNGKWLLIGGRTDGLHSRQPFSSFPSSNNNSSIYVVDVNKNQVWSSSLSSLSTNIQEQLQSTNMNFHQIADTLYVIGGYAYSNSQNDHITFPFLTTITVSTLIDDIVNGASIVSNFKQIEDTTFAVCGGQLNQINNTLYLVGGQKFTGRYNPMGHATYVQKYTNQIRSFTVNNAGTQLSFDNYKVTTDPVHLRRRDYNLMPVIQTDRTEGLMISAGVFQSTVDLPFLYPVQINAKGYTPIPSFNQYLSHYHSAHASLFDSTNNKMHMLFFGGMSQYYYQDSTLIKDDQVPFVKTISRLSRSSSGALKEFQLETKMPELIGASAEFIVNQQTNHTTSDLIKLPSNSVDTLSIGHIVGGIYSATLNPFAANQTSTTKAHTTVYEVILVKDETVSAQPIDGSNPYHVTFYPNPIEDHIDLQFEALANTSVAYYVSNTVGQILTSGEFTPEIIGSTTHRIQLDPSISAQALNVTLVFDSKYFVTKTVVKH